MQPCLSLPIIAFPSPSLPAPDISAHPRSISVHPCSSYSSLLHSCLLPAHYNTYQSLSSCSCPSLLPPCLSLSIPTPSLPIPKGGQAGIWPLPSPACRQPGCSQPPASGSPRPAACGGRGTVTCLAPWLVTLSPQTEPPGPTQPHSSSNCPNPGQLVCPPHIPHTPHTIPGCSQGSPISHHNPGAHQSLVPRATLLLSQGPL